MVPWRKMLRLLRKDKPQQSKAASFQKLPSKDVGVENTVCTFIPSRYEFLCYRNKNNLSESQSMMFRTMFSMGRKSNLLIAGDAWKIITLHVFFSFKDLRDHQVQGTLEYIQS